MLQAPARFLREVLDELQLVKTPGRKRSIRMTGVILLVSFAVGAYIALVDYVLTRVISSVIT